MDQIKTVSHARPGRFIAQILFTTLRLGALCFVWAGTSPTLFAQDPLDLNSPADDNRSPTEIFIHGAPISSTVRDLPQSTTVVQEHRLQEKGENSFQYEIEAVPNLTWSAGTSRPRFFIMRGVGELEQYAGAPNPSVATIIDDIDFSGLGLVTPMFDIDQVEVLRGPQGIQFGSSALAGAINVRSHDPTSYNTGRVELMAGNDELFAGGVAVGGSVPNTDDKLQIRFSAYNSQSNGFRDNLYLSRDNSLAIFLTSSLFSSSYFSSFFSLAVLVVCTNGMLDLSSSSSLFYLEDLGTFWYSEYYNMV
jgi:outer membrane receptor protein involved in Fe transport